MYPPIRIRKYLPDSTLKLVVHAYRIADRDGWARFFIPSGTTRLHTKGTWTPEGISIAALHPERPYVVHWWKNQTMTGFYVDMATELR